MLKQMRDGAKSTLVKFVLFGLLLLAMTGLALIGGQGVFRSALQDDAVARIGSTKIHAEDFERMVREELRRKNVREADAIRAGVPRKILQQEIDRRVFAMAANDAGILPGDVLAARQIRSIIAPLVKKGLSQQEALQRLEQAYNMNEPELVSSVKTDIATELLFRVITSGSYAPKQLVADALRFRNEYRTGAYFMLTAKDVPPVSPPSDATLKSYYTSVQGDYTLPEYRTLTVVTLSRKSVAATIKIPEAKLEQQYKDNLDEYKTPETRIIAQAVAPDEATAESVYKAAEKDNDLRAAAKNAGVKVSYLLPEPFTRKQIAPELQLAAFAGKAGAITAPN
ncbi:MAG: peptidylprolyl isomerase, partial [Alphaproteobacteria bacterium]|nr:peptidylprolyl isomerase [Alphaproteobacteria bacterium]